MATAINSAAPVAAIVITHEHADHWTPEHVRALRASSPDAPIYTTAATVNALAEAGIGGALAVSENARLQAGPFILDFYGRRHAVLHSSIPVIENVGVHVNRTLAWGGDCIVRAPFAADVLGVPIGSPWSSVGEIMDFVLDSAPRRAFLTHDGMLSTAGLGLYAQRVGACLAQWGGELLTIPRLTRIPPPASNSAPRRPPG